MTVNKRKKVVKYRGHTTHGCGSKKKARGAGNRGGRGMAGTGKRAHQKKPGIYKEFGREYFGKHGFKMPQSLQREEKTVNVGDLPARAEVDLAAMGFTKLLGAGVVKIKQRVVVAAASKRAKEKIEALGGQVVAAAVV